MAQQTDVLLIGSLRISADRIEELQDGRPILTLNRQGIRSVRLSHGFLARHPIIQLIFGVALALFSAWWVILGFEVGHKTHSR